MWSQGLVSPDWTALITPLPRSRVLEHLKYSLSAQDDSDWLSIVHRSAWIITIQLEGDWMNPCISTHHWSIVISYGHVTIILVVSLSGGNMMNHEESNESRDESRESTPAAPGLRLGFPRFKNLSHQRGFLQAIHSRGAKAPGRHGRLQGLFVVTFFYFG